MWFGFAYLGTLRDRILRYELFCMVLLSLNNMLIKFVQVVACRFSFYLLLLHNNPTICIMLQCINPLDFGPLGCLYVYRPFGYSLPWSVYAGVLPSFFSSLCCLCFLTDILEFILYSEYKSFVSFTCCKPFFYSVMFIYFLHVVFDDHFKVHEFFVICCWFVVVCFVFALWLVLLCFI